MLLMPRKKNTHFQRKSEQALQTKPRGKTLHSWLLLLPIFRIFCKKAESCSIKTGRALERQKTILVKRRSEREGKKENQWRRQWDQVRRCRSGEQRGWRTYPTRTSARIWWGTALRSHSNPKPWLARRSISPFPNGIMAFHRSPPSVQTHLKRIKAKGWLIKCPNLKAVVFFQKVFFCLFSSIDLGSTRYVMPKHF